MPTVLVNCRNGRRRKIQVVRQERKRSLAFVVPDLHNPEEVLSAGNSLAVEVDNLILTDISAAWHRPIFNDFAGGIILQARDEVDALICQLDEPLVINVAPVHDHDRPAFESQTTSNLDVAGLSVCDHGKRRQVPVMIEEQVEFDCALGPSELGPVEQRKGQADDAESKLRACF